MKLTRRTFTRSMLAAGATLAAPGIVRAADKELVVISYGGKLQEPHRWLADKMESEVSGLTVRLVPSESQDIVAQIKAAQGFSPYDLMPNGEPPHLIAQRDGYIQKLDRARLQNADNVVPEFWDKSGGFGVPATFSLIGLAYNEELVENAPTSWEDMWNEEYAGQVGICRTSSNLGLGTLAMAAKIFGGSESDLEPGWAKLKELDPVAGRSPSILAQMLERGEIAVAPLWNNDAAVAAAKGLPIKFVKPDPGPVAILSFMSEITGARDSDLAYRWMDGIISTEYQEMAADAPYYFGTTVKGVAVPEAARPYTPSTPEEVAALQTVDWSEIVKVRPELVERFDREFAI
ncbi:PotD/PotF family extracellular solute-binding protein [Jannaschia sp. 2305UL9-9]|uniref:ABC transporter substrate-binding protein n=1 Tax=Jannaschia sp. 2305UL9-9 TaxID=3121638 RepID=UPI00352780F2